MALNFNNLVAELSQVFPHLQNKIDEVIEWSGGALQHVIFSNAINPYIRSIFVYNTADSNEIEKLKVVEFLENMANSEDVEVRAVLTDTVLEELLDYPEEFSKIEPYLLRKTTSFLPVLKHAFGYKEKT